MIKLGIGIDEDDDSADVDDADDNSLWSQRGHTRLHSYGGHHQHRVLPDLHRQGQAQEDPGAQERKKRKRNRGEFEMSINIAAF